MAHELKVTAHGELALLRTALSDLTEALELMGSGESITWNRAGPAWSLEATCSATPPPDDEGATP